MSKKPVYDRISLMHNGLMQSRVTERCLSVDVGGHENLSIFVDCPLIIAIIAGHFGKFSLVVE